MKVGIIGYGFVGKALANGIKSEASIFKVDPKLKTTIEDLVSFDPDIIFICVGTRIKIDYEICFNHEIFTKVTQIQICKSLEIINK